MGVRYFFASGRTSSSVTKDTTKNSTICSHSGALSSADGVIRVDRDKCVGCYTCVLVCPYGCILPTQEGPVQKCELCLETSAGSPACVRGCPNRAIVYEER